MSVSTLALGSSIKCGEIAVGDPRCDGVCISEMANGGQLQERPHQLSWVINMASPRPPSSLLWCGPVHRRTQGGARGSFGNEDINR